MTIAEMFGQSAFIALLGMGIVFSFLIILIVFITLVAKLVKAMGWDADVRTPSAAGAAGASSGGAAGSAAVVAAIGAAVNEYRKSNQ